MQTERSPLNLILFSSSILTRLKCQYSPHIETSQLICCANQLNGFFTKAPLALDGLRTVSDFYYYWLFNFDAFSVKLQSSYLE